MENNDYLGMDGILSPFVKRKSNNTKKLNARVKRMLSGSPEVVAKITGFSKGTGAAKANIAYISVNGKLELETDKGEILQGMKEVNKFFADWEKDFNSQRDYKNRRDTMHLVLSMPEGVSEIDVKDAARGFAKKTFAANHEYVFALHTHDSKTGAPEHPHIHLAVKCRGIDGKQLNPRKGDLQQWRETFAEELRNLGQDAEATPRPARGVVFKAVKGVIKHIEQGDPKRAGRTSETNVKMVRENALELVDESKGKKTRETPWIDKIEAQRKRAVAALKNWAVNSKDPEPLTFNGKEQHNAKPSYGRDNRARFTGIYKPNIIEIGRKIQAEAHSRLRNVSGLDVVHNGRSVEMLLQPDARNNLERRGSRTNNDLRRADSSPNSTNGERINAVERFIAGMPSTKTRNEVIKDSLRAQFTKSKDRDIQPSQRKDKDLDR